MSKVLYFEDSKGKRRKLGVVNSDDETFEMIGKFLENYPHFKWYYTRVTERDNEKRYDVGSHTEFFVVVEEEE